MTIGPNIKDSELLNQPVSRSIKERVTKSAITDRISLWYLLTFLTLPYWGYMLYMIYQGAARHGFVGLFVGGILSLYALYEMTELVDGGRDSIQADVRRLFSRENIVETSLLLGSAIISIITSLYIHINVMDLLDRGYATTNEYIMAGLFTFAIIYLTWRSFGATFLAIVVVGILYGMFGYVAPGVLSHGGMSIERTLRTLVIGVNGFFGSLSQMTAAWIAPFLLYGGLLKAYGAFDLILRGAAYVGKLFSSGVAQAAVVASAVIGSVNGSQTANAGMTGSFTIPMMKDSGVRSKTSGGIEAVASTSGQVLPPVMGAGAFVMATLLGIAYVDVLVAGLIPAVILMITIIVAVHYVAAPQLTEADSVADNIDTDLSRRDAGLEIIKFGIPLGVLIYLLGVAQWSVQGSALYTVIAMVVMGILLPTGQATVETRNYRATFWMGVKTIKQTIVGFREGAIILAPIGIILIAISGVVDILEATGVPGVISLAIMDLSGGSLLLAGVLAMITCILLGLGMPTTGAYTIVALLVAPTLIEQFHMPELASHFFVFYAAILAGLTPPIATCVAVTTGIARSGFWETALEAIKISAPLFILPFSFLYHPEIVNHQGEITTNLLLTSGLIMLGALIMIHGINYRFKHARVQTAVIRAVFIGLGLVIMIYPGMMIQAAALGVGILLYMLLANVDDTRPLEQWRSRLPGA